MNFSGKFLVVLILTLFSTATLAREDIGDYSIADAMALEKVKEELGKDVKFYFGKQKHAAIAKTYAEVKTNRKTNAFNKSDEEACQWAFLSAMIALRDRAVREGGNAVVEIKSNYKGKLTTSNETFKCGAGAMIAGVALTGKIVKLK